MNRPLVLEIEWVSRLYYDLWRYVAFRTFSVSLIYVIFLFWFAVIFLYINTSCTSFVYKIIVNEINFFPTLSYFNMVSWEVTFLSNPWLIFLSSENYDTWSCAMSNALHPKTSLGFWMTPYLDWWRLLWMLPHGISTFFMASWIF